MAAGGEAETPNPGVATPDAACKNSCPSMSPRAEGGAHLSLFPLMLETAEYARPGNSLLLILTAILAAAPIPATDPPVLRGEWAATVGSSKTLRGRWIGQALPGQPDVMQGSWTLNGGTGRTVLRGTWTARKKGTGWQGTWAASDQKGRNASGTWNADGLEIKGDSLEGLFVQTSKDWVSGSWRSGRQQGNWWLKGSAPPHRETHPN